MDQTKILTEDQQKQAGEMADKILERVFSRISQVLTKEDMQTIDELEKDDKNGNAVKYFIMTKVPNFEAILEEELKKISSS